MIAVSSGTAQVDKQTPRRRLTDLAGPYRSITDTMLPHVNHVADPLHVIRTAIGLGGL